MLDRTDEVFKAKLKESRPAVEKVARWINRRGWEAIICPERVRPDVAQREEYSDDGDIHVMIDLKIHKVEVKGNPNYSFTKNNWPGGGRLWKNIIAETKLNIDTKGVPWRYFQVNKELTWAIIINPAKTRQYWHARQVYDSGAKRKKWYYFCPVKHTNYVDLDT